MDRPTPSRERYSLLSGHPFFRDWPPVLIERLASHARPITYQSGRQIFSKGDEGHGLYAVLSGIVRVSALSEYGKEIVLNLIGPGEIFGEVAVIDGRPRTADAAALTKCDLIWVDHRDFVSALVEEPTLANKLLEIVSARLRRTSEQVEDISFASFPSRLAKALLRLAEIQGSITDERPKVLITQKELGASIGLSRETTNRYLREWQKLRVISLRKGVCVIEKRNQLSSIASQI